MIERKLKLGGIIDGVGWNYFGWRHPDIPANASESIDFYVEKAIQLESAKFDAIFLADVSHIGPGMIPHYLSMFEGISILSALSMVTHSIGLTATIATSYADPFTVARQIASLDKISNGRAGWNAITSNPGGLANYSRTHLRKSDLYPLKEEFLEIVEGLWDSYEDDAFIRDKKSGVFYDPSKMHSLNYTGNYFSVDGPLIMPSHSPIVGKTEKDALEKLREIESLMPIGHRLPRPQLIGSAENVAEKIEHWYREGVMDILLIRQDYPAGFEDFIKLVVPILQEKGIFKKEYEANTLRGNLELPYPENMYKE